VLGAGALVHPLDISEHQDVGPRQPPAERTQRRVVAQQAMLFIDLRDEFVVPDAVRTGRETLQMMNRAMTFHDLLVTPFLQDVIKPSVMPTDMAAEVAGDPAVQEGLLNMHPIRRFATVEEVAETGCFLSGPSAAYITGEVLSVAGGVAI
jgi:hypothetical protein